jgi:transcriptional regulator with XRE-family HTH domain
MQGKMLIKLTKKQRDDVQEIFKKLSAQVGTKKELAKSLNISRGALSLLLQGDFLPGARICILLEKLYGIKKEELRPDIFSLD